MGVLEILDRCIGDILLASWRYLIVSYRYTMCVMDIFYGCPGNIWWVSWRYLTDVLEIFVWSPGDIWLVSLIYIIGVLENFVWCLRDIWSVYWRY